MEQISFFGDIGCKEPGAAEGEEKETEDSRRPAGQRKEILCGEDSKGMPQGGTKRRR